MRYKGWVLVAVERHSAYFPDRERVVARILAVTKDGPPLVQPHAANRHRRVLDVP